jgi:hypothetical protein
VQVAACGKRKKGRRGTPSTTQIQTVSTQYQSNTSKFATIIVRAVFRLRRPARAHSGACSLRRVLTLARRPTPL